MEQHPLLHLGVVAIEKGAFGSPVTTVVNFYTLESPDIWFETSVKTVIYRHFE